MQIPLETGNGGFMRLAGRLKEKKTLIQLLDSSKSEFVAIYGRRRIGKTYLVNQIYGKEKFYFDFTGTPKISVRLQIKKFSMKFERVFNIKLPQKPKDWIEAFEEFEIQLEKHKSSKNKKIIFFDELPWLSSRNSGFLNALESFWNTYLSKRSDIILIVCGSAASWMITHIVNNRGGLHNRLTRNLQLQPFTLYETREYFKLYNAQLTEEQILEIYMAVGGVAYYLGLYEKGQSAAQFINNVCFEGELQSEFERLYESLFENYQTHMQIIRALGKHREGLSQSQIADSLGLKSGGTLSKILSELEISGFTLFTPQPYSKKKNGVYRLIDEYSLFYLNWIEPKGKTASDTQYWQKQQGKTKYNTWSGFSFEIVCLRHLKEITKSLGISGLTTTSYSYRSPTAQIDLIVDRSDGIMNLCEIKYSKSNFTMNQSESAKIKQRQQELIDIAQRKIQVFVVLITAHPAKKNQHYLNTFDSEVNLSDLFATI